LKILQISPFLNEQHGGTEIYCFNLSKSLVRYGHELHIFTSKTKPQTPKYQYLEGIHVHRFSAPIVLWNINPVCFMLNKLIKENTDICHVHSHLYFTSNQAIIAKLIRKIMEKNPPVILHLHGGIGNPPDNTPSHKKIAKKIYDHTLGKLTLKAADTILSTSQHDAKNVIKQYKINPEKIEVIPNAVNIEDFKPKKKTSSNETFNLLYIGDLELWKGIQYLIKAVEKLTHINEIGKKIKLTIVGDGALKEKLQKMAKQLPITFTGQIPHHQIPELLNKADAFILPSLWEGLPTTILEAMAAKVPVIATNVGGITEVIKNEETGIIVKPADPDSIVKAVTNLINNNNNNMVEKAYQLVRQKFSLENVAKKINEIYSTIRTTQ